MGNGASGAHVIVIDGESYDANKIRGIVANLKAELKTRDSHVEQLERELAALRNVDRERDDEMKALRHEVDKLKSVLDQTVHRDNKKDLVTKINEGPHLDLGARAKKQGVSGESLGQFTVELKHHDKDFR